MKLSLLQGEDLRPVITELLDVPLNLDQWATLGEKIETLAKDGESHQRSAITKFIQALSATITTNLANPGSNPSKLFDAINNSILFLSRLIGLPRENEIFRKVVPLVFDIVTALFRGVGDQKFDASVWKDTLTALFGKLVSQAARPAYVRHNSTFSVVFRSSPENFLFTNPCEDIEGRNQER
jgi:hypothetical protein